MVFTMEQFDALELGDWELSATGIVDQSKENVLKIFNWLPNPIQGLAVSWGASDTEFREKSLICIIEGQSGLLVDEFQDRDMEIKVFDFAKSPE